MKKAWEIAKAGQQKFGGKVKEYFAESLKLAWKLAKTTVNKISENFGFAKVAEQNGNIYFALDEIEDMKVNLLSDGFNLKGEKVIKRKEIKNYQEAVNNKLNKKVRIYSAALGRTKLEIKAQGTSRFLTFDNGKVVWS